MNYEFPTIYHIDDVLPYVKDNSRFTVVQKDGGYTVINYVRYDDETFEDCAIRKECRGLIFDTESGEIISRPFHKFFNVNENADTALGKVDLSQEHYLLDKLDGSMIRPLILDGGVRWGTTMGITDISLQVENYVVSCRDTHQYEDFALMCYDEGYTPLFEWMSRKNRIVLDHEEDKLVLLACRNNVTGKYDPMWSLDFQADIYHIPLVGESLVEVGRHKTHELVEVVKEMEGEEGIVIRFQNGHMLKLKSEWYINLHRVRSSISNTRRLVEAILEDRVDDLYPILDEKDREDVKAFVNIFHDKVDETVNVIIDEAVGAMATGSRKDFALSDTLKEFPLYRSIIFRLWDRKSFTKIDVQALVRRVIKDHTSNTKRFEAVKIMFGNLEWSGGMFGG